MNQSTTGDGNQKTMLLIEAREKNVSLLEAERAKVGTAAVGSQSVGSPAGPIAMAQSNRDLRDLTRV